MLHLKLSKNHNAKQYHLFHSFIVLFIVSLCLPCYPVDFNFNGWGDTMKTTFKDTAAHYHSSKTFNNTNYTDGSVVNIVTFADTVCAGYTKDTASLAYGYALGFQTLSVKDTPVIIWGKDVCIDTINTGKLANYKSTIGNFNQRDTLCTSFYTKGIIDTITTGGVKQYISWRTFIPQWSPYIRYWVLPLTSTCVHRRVNVLTTINRRLYSPAR